MTNSLATLRFDELRVVRNLLRWSHFGQRADEVEDIEALLACVPAFRPRYLESNLLQSLAFDPDRRGRAVAFAMEHLPEVTEPLGVISVAIHRRRVRDQDRQVLGVGEVRPSKPPVQRPHSDDPERDDPLVESEGRGAREAPDWSERDRALRQLSGPLRALGLAPDQALLAASLPQVVRATIEDRLLEDIQSRLSHASQRFSAQFAPQRVCGRAHWDRDALNLIGRFVWPMGGPIQIPPATRIPTEGWNRDLLIIDLDDDGFAHVWVNHEAGVATVRAHFRAPPSGKEDAARQIASRIIQKLGGTYAGWSP